MSQEVIAQLVGTFGLLVYIVYQLLDRFLFKKPVDGRLFKLETNHIPHLEADIREIKETLRRLEDRSDKHNSRLVRLETLEEVQR